MFVATLYSSDSSQIMRYTDEVSARLDVIGGTRISSDYIILICILPRERPKNSANGLLIWGSCQLSKTMQTHPIEMVSTLVRCDVNPILKPRSKSETVGTEFELGLELDSAEVRGILIYGGQDWGRVVFDFRS